MKGSVSVRVRGSPKPEGVEEDEETRRLLGSHSSTHRPRRSESKRLRLAGSTFSMVKMESSIKAQN
nr:hypothetical protein Iba_scaffold60570CG0010 [Ipomoea batatas]GMC91103.1 hypothetical protein Iba_scaffold64676CG0010 [Ipomoea batatas]